MSATRIKTFYAGPGSFERSSYPDESARSIDEKVNNWLSSQDDNFRLLKIHVASATADASRCHMVVIVEYSLS